MKITRDRYVIMKNERKKILCGSGKNMFFLDIDKIGGARIWAYDSISSLEDGWCIHNLMESEPIEIVKIKETVELTP